MGAISPHRGSRNQRGVTLVEALIAMIIFLLVLTGIYQIYHVHHSIFSSGESRVDVQFNARYSMAEMARQVRMTGYYPENFDANPANNLINPVAIQVATNSALAVLGDADGSAASSVFLFCLDAAGSLIRVRSLAAGTPPVGTAAAYTCNGGQILGRSVTNLAFAYFDASNNPIPNPPTPPYQLDGEGLGVPPLFGSTAQRAAVRRVVITFTTTESVPRQQPQTYTLTSDLRLRNLN